MTLLPLSLDDTNGNYKCVCHNEVVRNDRQPEKKGFCGRHMCFMFCNDIGNQHATIFQFPENIYQMPQNTVDVCDIIEKGEAGEKPGYGACR